MPFPPVKIDNSNDDPLTPASPPVRFDSSVLCSFSPIGESDSGTIYISDCVDSVWSVRICGGAGRAHAFRDKWNVR